MAITEKDLEGLKTLNDLISKISSSEEIPKKRWLTDGEPHPLVQQTEELCCELFITGQGQVRKTMIDLAFKNYEIQIVKGESDSFGWLTGVLITDKGDICYG